MTHIMNPPPPSFYGAKFNQKIRFSLKHAELTFFQMIFGILSLCSKKHQAKSGMCYWIWSNA